MAERKSGAGHWQPELNELHRRKRFALELGGADKIDRQRASGRQTVRERIEQLLDPGSFHELGAIAGRGHYDATGQLTGLTPANCVMGRGRIDGRPVVVTGDDFTVRGGTADASIREKLLFPEQMARDLRLPIVRLIEGSGGGGSVRTIETTGSANLPGGHGQTMAYDVLLQNLGIVPTVSLAMGSVAGLGAARLAASHYSVMVKDSAAVFVAGPPVVAGIGQDISKQALGGYQVQLAAGGVDAAADTEQDALEKARRFLSYLPASIYEVAARHPAQEPKNGDANLLFNIVPRDPRKVYKMRRIIQAVVDAGSFFEIGEKFGRSMITGFARIDGWPVVLLASDPYHYGGAWTADSCQKTVKMVDLAETFHLPVVYFADCPGFHVGLEAEKAGTVRHGVRAMAAVNQSTVPWCAMIIRNAFGIAGGAHRPIGRMSVRYAWLSARWGSLPLQGGIEAAYRAELEESDDPDTTLAEISDRLERLRSPFRTAETFAIEEMIDPRDSRRLLVEFANLAAPLREPGPSHFTMRP